MQAGAYAGLDDASAQKARLSMLGVQSRVSEREQDRAEQILVRLDGERFAVRTRSLRHEEGGERPFFERNWPDFLTGAIYA